MNNLIDTIYCKILILLNWLPTYQIILGLYLSIPVIVLTYFFYRSDKSPVFYSIILISIWTVQMILWSMGYKVYYGV